MKAAAFLIRVRPPVNPEFAKPLRLIIVPRPFGAGWTLAVPAKAEGCPQRWQPLGRPIAGSRPKETSFIRNFIALSRVYLLIVAEFAGSFAACLL